jgi:hypothetical protein
MTETMIPKVSKTLEQRLSEARAAASKRDEATKHKLQERELELLELEEKYTSECGARGESFEIVMIPECAIVLKLGDNLCFKRLQDSKFEFEDVYNFVIEQVAQPSQGEVVRLFGQRRGAVTRCSDILIAMHRGEVKRIEGKA